jgi:hypothetical protein
MVIKQELIIIAIHFSIRFMTSGDTSKTEPYENRRPS